MIQITYCEVADIRAITNLSTSDISDSEINNLISYATYQINAEIGATLYVRLNDSNYVINTVDGTNKTFILKYSPIGDLNNDGTVDASDIEVWRKSVAENTWTKLSSPIASIDDHEMGKFTFAEAPNPSYDYVLKYVWFPIPFNHNLIKKACAELTAYLCFLKMNLKDVESYKLGKLEVTKTARHPGLVSFYDRYRETLGMIRGRTMLRAVNWEMTQKMAAELLESLAQAGPGISSQLQPGEVP